MATIFFFQFWLILNIRRTQKGISLKKYEEGSWRNIIEGKMAKPFSHCLLYTFSVSPGEQTLYLLRLSDGCNIPLVQVHPAKQSLKPDLKGVFSCYIKIWTSSIMWQKSTDEWEPLLSHLSMYLRNGYIFLSLLPHSFGLHCFGRASWRIFPSLNTVNLPLVC